jgi:hypothetical protein
MTLSDPNDLEVKFGRDKKLEDEANEWLAKNVGSNARGVPRDAEKMSYEHGFTPAEDLQHYDPAVDWPTKDSVFMVIADPADVVAMDPTICAEVDDGNVRARNPRLEDRAALRRHIDDASGWGSAADERIPLLGANDGPRKVCRRCGRSQGLQYFSPDIRNRDGLHSWCKGCRREVTSRKRAHGAQK